MKHISYIPVLWTLCLMLFVTANGQKLDNSELKTFLTTATEKILGYLNVFKNLTVEESKTFETFDADGKLKSRKKVLRIFPFPSNKAIFSRFWVPTVRANQRLSKC